MSAAGCGGRARVSEGPAPAFVQPETVVAPDRGADSADASSLPSVAAACSDEVGPELARVSCDGTRILVSATVDLAPLKPAPGGESKKALDRVAQLMRERSDILLVRIEVTARRSFGRDIEQNSALLAEAQSRADAILQSLYRNRGISAERLEAVGYPRTEQSDAAFPVVFRIVQRRRIEKSSTPE